MQGKLRVGLSLKTRLYSIIAFVGLLPLFGVAATLLIFDSASRDASALDRAARGSIHLERINRLVSGVVMEAASICLRIG